MKTITQLMTATSLLVMNTISAQNDFSVKGFHHVESVASDGKYIYAADIGKELNPTAKDGDGRIYRLDQSGRVIDSAFTKEAFNAPKGITIANGILFVADIDRLVALDLNTGRKLYDITFTNAVSFLNDITVFDEHSLFISATDKSMIFKVDLASKSYTELPTGKTIAGVNGLFYDKGSNRLYVNGFGSDNKPNGIVGYVNLTNHEFTQLGNIEGYYDGIWLKGNMLYVSNWVGFEKKGIIQTIDVASRKVSELKLSEPITGPADFTITDTTLIVPEMMTGEIRFITLRN